jgi:cytochrome c peroxidase
MMIRSSLLSRRVGAVLVAAFLGLALAGAAAAQQVRPFTWNVPENFPIPRVPADNPMTWEKVELGRLLFHDTRLSGNQTQSCGSCHRQEIAFTDALPQGVGSTGQVHPRGSMSLANVAYASTLTWANPLMGELAQQALVPMFGESPVELGMAGLEDELFARLHADSRYRRMFREAFPAEADPISLATITRALAAFQRTLISGNSPLDRWALGIDDNAISVSAIRGIDLFFSEEFECFHCHGGFNFSDSTTHSGTTFIESAFHNNELYNLDGNGAYPADNQGVFEITNDPDDMGRFKAPTLRNIALTAPYMHDGSLETLEEVIDHYAAGGAPGVPVNLSSGFVRGFRMTAQQKQDILAFLESLTDDEFVTHPRFGDPFAAVACAGDCDFGGSVTVDELITGINVALGEATYAHCVGMDVSGDGEVSVDELVSVINLALAGCPQ